MEETLLHLIIGFQKYAEMNRKNPHESLHYSFQLFVQQCNKNDVIPPKNYKEFIQVLQLPAVDWGIDSITHYYPAHIPLIDKYLRPVPQTAEIIYSIDENIDQFSTEQIDNHLHQVHMRNLLAYCYEHNLDDAYRKIRLFLINPEHAVIPSIRLAAFKNEFTDDRLTDLIDMFYELVPHIENYYKCPYCHWTLVFDEYEKKLVCNYSSPCHERTNLQHGVPFVEPGGDSLRYYRLKRGIQRFTLIPGISESRLQERLEKKGYTVVMYPNIDEYDLHASRGSIQLKIDTKDYLSPFSLAKNLLKDMEKDVWSEDVLYVIPYEQYAINRQYIKDVYRVIRRLVQGEENPDIEEKAGKLKIIDERFFLKKVGDTSDEAVIEAINSLNTNKVKSY